MRSLAWLLLCSACACTWERASTTLGVEHAAVSTFTDTRAWSQQPPGLSPVDVPQFVAVTFDDNFVSGLGDPPGGMTWATSFFEPLVNPAGSAFAATFDGTPVRTSFYDNCVYLEDENTRKSWATSFRDGHEIANHTVHHSNGLTFSEQAWVDEIAPCTMALSNTENGVGVSVDGIKGFRAPFLAYGSAMFGALKAQGLWYDSTLQSCWGAGQDGKNCAWPYTLDQGSPDGVDLTAKFATPMVPPSAGLWELTPSALFVPPDELAAQYGFEAGLRQRIPTDMAAPSYYEAATGRLAPLDITLFVDAELSAPEVLAILKYTLDLRLQGNRAPLIFIAHTHVYASNYSAPKAPEASARQGVIEQFVQYALSKSMVRMRPVADIMNWMRAPQPLDGKVTMPVGAAGAAGSAGAPSTAGSGGSGNGVGGSGAGGASGSATAGVFGVAGSTPNSEPVEATDESCSCRFGSQRSGGLPYPLAASFLLLALAMRRRGARQRTCA